MRKTSTIEEHSASRLTPSTPWRIKSFSIKDGYTIEVIFNDGTQGVFDLEIFIHKENSGVFRHLQNYKKFQEADLVYGVITWPGNIDIASDALYRLAKDSSVGEKLLVN
jgi:hypothetical protein